MPVESATYISQLDQTNPDGSAPKAEGDDHLRLLKSTLKATFPAFVGAPVTATEAELSRISGLSGNIQAQLDSKAPLASPALTGSPTAPTAALGTSSTQIASTAFVAAAIASVNSQVGASISIDPSAAISATAGQHIVCTNAGAVTVTLPAAPTQGQMVWVTPGNGRTDNVIARNGQLILGLAEDMTIDNPNITVELRFINSTLGWRLT